jgi:hypothetical protein
MLISFSTIFSSGSAQIYYEVEHITHTDTQTTRHSFYSRKKNEQWVMISLIGSYVIYYDTSNAESWEYQMRQKVMMNR